MNKITGSHPALFLDLDNTIRYVKDPNRCFPENPNDIAIYPGVPEKIKNFKDAGFYIFGVSNQGGIELGHITAEMCEKIMIETNRLTGYLFDDILWAPYLKSEDRKPNIGMIKKLSLKYNIDLDSSIMIGDKDSDLMCSLNAGIKQFFYAKDFFVEGHAFVTEERKRRHPLIDQMR